MSNKMDIMNTIGKSGVDWKNVPVEYTHLDTACTWLYRTHTFCREPTTPNPSVAFILSVRDGAGLRVFGKNHDWGTSRYVSREEDLGLNKKVVRCIDDLEVGMFVKFLGFDREYFVSSPHTLTSTETWNHYPFGSLQAFNPHNFEKLLWSYTYSGEYQPVQAPLEDTKMKALEATVALAQKQLQEYKSSKM